MSYYDNVKDDVKEKDDTGKPNFETLRKAAEEHTEEEEEREGDDTSIEVLEDGLKSKEEVRNEKQVEEKKQGQNEPGKSENPLTRGNRSGGSAGEGFDTSAVEEKLDRIIQQNQRMIEILESFGS